MKSIVNRREKLRANDLPPEIPDTTSFVTKTDKASASKLGLVKIGDNVNVTSGGVISVSDASSEAKGVVKLGTGLSVNAETGAVDVTATGGMNYTKLFDGAAASSSVQTFDEGVHLLTHKIILISTYTANHDYAYALLIPELVPSDETAIWLEFYRSDGLRKIIFTDTGFTMPNNMNAARVIIYALD